MSTNSFLFSLAFQFSFHKVYSDSRHVSLSSEEAAITINKVPIKLKVNDLMEWNCKLLAFLQEWKCNKAYGGTKQLFHYKVNTQVRYRNPQTCTQLDSWVTIRNIISCENAKPFVGIAELDLAPTKLNSINLEFKHAWKRKKKKCWKAGTACLMGKRTKSEWKITWVPLTIGGSVRV